MATKLQYLTKKLNLIIEISFSVRQFPIPFKLTKIFVNSRLSIIKDYFKESISLFNQLSTSSSAHCIATASVISESGIIPFSSLDKHVKV